MEALQVILNEEFVKANDTVSTPAGAISFTPPLDEAYWAIKVEVSDNQAIVAFPKFWTYGIGFQHEEADWNTNLPYTVSAAEIFGHISHNKGDDTISDERCIEAIEMIRKAIFTTNNQEYQE